MARDLGMATHVTQTPPQTKAPTQGQWVVPCKPPGWSPDLPSLPAQFQLSTLSLLNCFP